MSNDFRILDRAAYTCVFTDEVPLPYGGNDYLCRDGIVRKYDGYGIDRKLYYFDNKQHAETTLNNYLNTQEPHMNTFNTDADILNALLSGKKLRDKPWGKETYIHMVDNKIVCNKGVEYMLCLHPVIEWEEWKAPLTLADLKPGQFAKITGHIRDKQFLHIGKTVFCFGGGSVNNPNKVTIIQDPSWVSGCASDFMSKIECQLIDNPFAS